MTNNIIQHIHSQIRTYLEQVPRPYVAFALKKPGLYSGLCIDNGDCENDTHRKDDGYGDVDEEWIYRVFEDHDGALCVYALTFEELNNLKQTLQSEELVNNEKFKRYQQLRTIAKHLNEYTSFGFKLFIKITSYWRKGIDYHTYIYDDNTVEEYGDLDYSDKMNTFYLLVTPEENENNTLSKEDISNI